MPNRRRRKLSTAMSAVAALAVASPCAYFLVYESRGIVKTCGLGCFRRPPFRLIRPVRVV
ncbi:hypothetical protein DKM27_03865 [Mycobacterium tuberculosis variant bovis]|nr:hypothetical protein DKM27_03865 [Mycobacterium tuberculosis variant bovis]